jgi:transposase InsO family protein
MTDILSDDKRQQVLALGRLGWTLRRIERVTGVRRETAGAYLKAAGLAVRPNGDPAHTGTIITTRPDEMWGTDATRFYTEADGWCWFFGVIDHHTDELLGWHVAKLGDRWAALEPIRQGVRHAFGGFSKEVARGLKIRCDWGPQYIADAWINEVKWLGITISPSYVGEPECNGVIERFMRTLKEQCIYLHRFRSLTEAQRIIGEFIPRYNTAWLIERLGHRTPMQARADALGRAA